MSHLKQPKPLLTMMLTLTSRRQVHVSAVMNAEPGGGRDSRPKDLEKMVSDEKRGVYRVLDIGKPSPFEKRKPFEARRIKTKGPPR
jgi:hypothetical protein